MAGKRKSVTPQVRKVGGGRKDEPRLNPANPTAAYKQMAPKWAMIQTVLDGTGAMREAGETYLPVHDSETTSNYRSRLMQTTLFNMTDLTLDSLVGKPFSDKLEPNKDVPKQIVDLWDDIDMQGNNMFVFCRQWFREGLAKAFCHLIIDMPKAGPPADGVARTLADDARENMRPYWVLVKPEQVIGVRSEIVNGIEKLTQVRIFECITGYDGFEETETKQVRVLEPGFITTYEFIPDNDRDPDKGEWRVKDTIESGYPGIPFVTFYANRSGVMQGKPPIEDLVYLNVRHWQSTSDQVNILTVARFPLLAASGGTNSNDEMVIGPKKLLTMRDPTARFYYVEHKGASITAGRQDLLDLEQQMSAYGAQFLRRTTGNVTATSRALDSVEAVSSLKDMTLRFMDTVKSALDITAEWLKIDGGKGGSVTLTTDYSAGNVDPAKLKTLVDSRNNGSLSREDFLLQLKELGILSDEFDPPKNLARLYEEAAKAGIPATAIKVTDVLQNYQPTGGGAA